jgi:hypothetical protein
MTTGCRIPLNTGSLAGRPCGIAKAMAPGASEVMKRSSVATRDIINLGRKINSCVLVIAVHNFHREYL